MKTPAPPERSPCGCLWVRVPPGTLIAGAQIAGDVVIAPCGNHSPSAQVVQTFLKNLADEDDKIARRVGPRPCRNTVHDGCCTDLANL